MHQPARALVAAEREGGSSSAAPFDSVDAAIDAALVPLSLLGLGQWRLVIMSPDDLHDPDELVVPLVVPEEPRLLALRADEPPSEDLAGERGAIVLSVARTVASLLAVAGRAERAGEHAARAERESTTDALTGLGNARAWWRTLSREAARCDRHDISALVAVIDLDELKKVNDEEGHLAGDVLLRVVATALKAAVRSHDLVARIGGDEFGVLAVDYEPMDSDALVARMGMHLDAAAVAASIGTARYSPGGRITETFREADASMYRAKRARGQAAS